MELKFTATPEAGEVSALLLKPEGATHLMVLGHGAGADTRHATMQTIAERLAETVSPPFAITFRSWKSASRSARRRSRSQRFLPRSRRRKRLVPGFLCWPEDILTADE